MVSLTVFTPTYNRVELLKKGYDALKRQTNKNFIWMIIDDGSTDNTASVVKEWQNSETGFEIQYIYKENGGLHTAYNAAIKELRTELAVCVDSDDYLTDTAVEEILTVWKNENGKSIAGIVGLDCFQDGTIIGDYLPEQKCVNLIDLLIGKYDIQNGDRKIVVRSELYKAVAPQKVFPGEKNFNPHYMHLQISMDYDFIVYNRPICVVDYQPTGMSANMFKQYANSPNSFCEIRKLYLSFPNTSLKFKLKHSIHYVSSSLIARKKHFIWESPKKLLTIASIIPGAILSSYIKWKVGRNNV